MTLIVVKEKCSQYIEYLKAYGGLGWDLLKLLA